MRRRLVLLAALVSLVAVATISRPDAPATTLASGPLGCTLSTQNARVVNRIVSVSAYAYCFIPGNVRLVVALQKKTSTGYVTKVSRTSPAGSTANWGASIPCPQSGNFRIYAKMQESWAGVWATYATHTGSWVSLHC